MGLIDHHTNPISERVIGAAIEVHRHLGPGLLESSYDACLRRELQLREIAIAGRSPYPCSTREYQSQRATSSISSSRLPSSSRSSPSTSSCRFIPPNS